MHGFDGPVGVNELNAFILGSQLEVAIANTVIEFHIFRLESAFVLGFHVIARASAGEPDRRFDIEKKCRVRDIRIADQMRELANEV